MVSGEMKASSWTEYYSAVGGMCEFASLPRIISGARCASIALVISVLL
jgi:hypothetical protein